MDTMAQLRQINSNFTVKSEDGVYEFNLLDYTCWEDCVSDILDAAGENWAFNEIPDWPEKSNLVKENEICDVLFEWIGSKNPLVVTDYALYEGVSLATAMEEAEERLVGRARDLSQLAEDYFCSLHQIGDEDEVTRFINWDKVRDLFLESHILAEHFVFRKS